MPDPIDNIFSAAAGQEIPGGCDKCNAEQRLEQVATNVWTLVVAHDDWCPFLRARRAGSN
jgi:hypothetical protein